MGTALAGVGENLQDHLQLRMIYKVSGVPTLNEQANSVWGRARMGLQYLVSRSGPMAMSPSQLGAFAPSDPRHERANVEYHVQPLSLDRFGEPLHRFSAFTASVCNLRPTSRGTVGIVSADPDAAPRIAPQYLSTVEDRRVAVESIRLTRRIVGGPSLAAYSPTEFLPGEACQSDEELADDEYRDNHLSPGGDLPNGAGIRPDGGGGPPASSPRSAGAADCRCVGDAHDHLGQHQRPHADDRGKGRCDDEGRRGALTKALPRAEVFRRVADRSRLGQVKRVG